MRIRTLSIGKTNVDFIKTGVAQYNSRITKYIKFEWQEIPDVKHRNKLPEKELKIAEGQTFLKHINPNERVIILDERGKLFTSKEFSKWLGDGINLQSQDICFIIGGAYGFSEEIKSRAELIMSLSKMTFTHQMIRLFFIEQVYRALTIIRGEPYHHE